MASEPSRAESSGTRIGEPEDWGVKCRFARAFDGLSPQYEPHHKGRFDKNQPAGGMQNAKSPPKGSGGQTSQYKFRAHLYTQQETNVNAQVALRRLLGTRLGGISEKTLAAGLGPGKEIDVDISAASRSPSPPVSSQRRRCLIHAVGPRQRAFLLGLAITPFGQPASQHTFRTAGRSSTRRKWRRMKARGRPSSMTGRRNGSRRTRWREYGFRILVILKLQRMGLPNENC
jgi:hypothetical protein